MKPALFALFSSLLLATPVRAEINNCNGVYTDRPCTELGKGVEVPPADVTQAPQRSIDKEAAVTRSKKRKLLHDLTTKQIKARKDLGIEFDISEAEERCLEETTSLDQCRTTVRSLDDTLDARMVAHTNAKNSQDAHKAEKKPRPQENNPAQGVVAPNTVVVVQQQIVVTPTPLAIIQSGPLYPLPPRSRRSPQRGAPEHEHPHRDQWPVEEPPLRVHPNAPSANNAGIVTVP